MYRRNIPLEWHRKNAINVECLESHQVYEEKWEVHFDKKESFPCFDCGKNSVAYRIDEYGFLADKYCDSCWNHFEETDEKHRKLESLVQKQLEQSRKNLMLWNTEMHLNVIYAILEEYPIVKNRDIEISYYIPGLDWHIAENIDIAIRNKNIYIAQKIPMINYPDNCILVISSNNFVSANANKSFSLFLAESVVTGQNIQIRITDNYSYLNEYLLNLYLNEIFKVGENKLRDVDLTPQEVHFLTEEGIDVRKDTNGTYLVSW